MKLEFIPEDHGAIIIELIADIQGHDLIEIWQDTESIFMRFADLPRFIHELQITQNQSAYEN
jgi:hypothetical protein